MTTIQTIGMESYVYFFQKVNPPFHVKIGLSINPKQRFYNVSYHVECKLKVLGYIEGGEDKEKETHKAFSKDRVKREWFRPSQRLLDFIEENSLGTTLPTRTLPRASPKEMQLGERIKTLRIESGMTQAVLAQKAGMRVINLASHERGLKVTPLSFLHGVALAHALGVKPEELLREGEPASWRTKRKRKLKQEVG